MKRKILALTLGLLAALPLRAADKTITDLTPLTSAAVGDELMIYDISASAPKTRKITIGNISASLNPPWAQIESKPITITTASGATLTLAANSTLVTQGAYTTTLVSTATTNVTLPTTGTLATIGGTEALTGKTVNGLTISTTTGTLTLATAKTLAVNNTLTLSGTDGASLNISDAIVSTGSYANPAWVTSFAWSKLTGTPTTLSGYGITDAQGLDSDLTAIAALTTATFGRSLLTESSEATARSTLGAASLTGTETLSNKTLVAPVLGVATATSITASGNSTFNGTNNTAPNQTGLAASSSTLVTKVQGDEEWLWQSAFRRRVLTSGAATFYQSGAVSSTNFNGVGLMQLDTTAAAWAKATLSVALHDSYLFGIRFDKRFRIAVAVRTELGADTTKKARLLVGSGYSSAVVASDVDALSGPGIGAEITYESGEYRARLIRFNGSYATSGGYAVLASAANDLALILENVGDGNINLYAATTSNGIANPSTTPVLTMTGGPTGGCDFGACVEFQVTNHSSTPGSASCEVEFRGGAILLEP